MNKDGEYKSVRSFPVDGADVGVVVSSLVDIAEKRGMLLARRACTPEIPPSQTEFIRGQYAEVQNLIKALRELMPGSIDPNP